MSSYKAVIPTGGSAPKKCFLLPSTALSTFLKRSEFFSKPWNCWKCVKCENVQNLDKNMRGVPKKSLNIISLKNRDGYNRWILPKFPILLGKTYLKFKRKIDSQNLRGKSFFDDIWRCSTIFRRYLTIFNDIQRYLTIFQRYFTISQRYSAIFNDNITSLTAYRPLIL